MMGTNMHRIVDLMQREIRRITSRPLYLLTMFCAPLFCSIFFTSLMHEGLPQSLPAGVVDEDNTSTTRQVIRNLDAFQQTEIVRQYSSFSEAREAMQSGEIYAFYYIPNGTTEKALRSEQPKVSFYTNAAYLIPGSLLYRDMKMMSEYASGAVGRETLLAKGYTLDQAMGFLQPIQMDMRAVGNPWLNYSIYLCNTLLPAILVLIIMLVTIFSVHSELKEGTGNEWMNMAGDNVYIGVIGKLLLQTIVFIVMIIFCQILLYGYLDFPLHSGIWTMLLAGLMLVLASQGFALFLCAVIPSLRWALSLATLWGVLSFPISGFSFPVMAMPPALKALSYLFPLRHYFLIYVDQALNGLPMHYSTPFYLALLAFILMPLLNMWMLKSAMRKYHYIP